MLEITSKKVRSMRKSKYWFWRYIREKHQSNLRDWKEYQQKNGENTCQK